MPTPTSSQPSSSDNPIVLIVDDEHAIRDLLGRFLSLQGVRTLGAASGPEAVELYLRHRGDVSLVLMDVRMPGLSGPETVENLKYIHQGVRYCFMSGDLGDHDPELLLKGGALHLFRKPFDLSELARVVRQLAGVEA
jgi:CheY-like chemotaxis protein